jgi:hypothetical protein
MTKSNYELERENFYKWIESCPLTDYRLSNYDLKSLTYEFHFNSVDPSIDQLIDYVLVDLEK